MAAAGAPTFLLLVDGPAQKTACVGVCADLGAQLAPVLGFAPRIALAALSPDGAPPVGERTVPELDAAIDEAAAAGSEEVFLLAAVLDLHMRHKQCMVESVRGARRRHAQMQVYYDDVDPCHPLLLHAFVDRAMAALSKLERATPGRLGILLVAAGEGDPDSRAHSYRLMRLLWEQLACAHGDVAFLRHDRTPLPEQLEACARRQLEWLVVPQLLWATEHQEYARVILEDDGRRREARPWPLAEALGEHPNVVAWLAQRGLALWKGQRQKDSGREPSARYAPARESAVHGAGARCAVAALADPIPDELRYGASVIADLADGADLAPLLERFGLDGERFFVKVTWHGYARGTYTDPVALDALLSALPGRAIVLEGHTSSRNNGGDAVREWDWEHGARAHRAFIQREDRAFLERTGLAEVLERHRAQYLNVTEAHWDGACADPKAVQALLTERGVTLHEPEMAAQVPAVVLEHRGAPLISFARFKGPTRLSISNMFGLLPPPLRSAWHGPNITYFARVCCDLAKLYGALLTPYGMVEGLSAAVRWDRQGLYRSRWGNYDLIPQPGLLTLSSGLAGADVLASRLQGQDVRRSAFFDVVQAELGFDDAAADAPIDEALIRRLA